MTQIELELGGQKRTLRFSMGTLKFIGNLTGSDPLAFGTGITENPGRLFDMVKVIVHAGLLQECKSVKANADFNEEDVDDWVSDLDTSAAMEIIGHYSKAFSAEESNDPNVKRVTVVTKN